MKGIETNREACPQRSKPTVMPSTTYSMPQAFVTSTPGVQSAPPAETFAMPTAADPQHMQTTLEALQVGLVTSRAEPSRALNISS